MTDEESGDFAEVYKAIGAGKLSEAQAALEAMPCKTAEWHYAQALVFREKKWFSESRAQLKLALEEDPCSQTYQAALDELEQMANKGSEGKKKSKWHWTSEDSAECCLACGCELCCSGICEFLSG